MKERKNISQKGDNNMNSLYNNIEIGDYIEFPNSILKVKGGIVSSVKGLNGHAKIVECLNGHKFPISKYKTDYVLWCE